MPRPSRESEILAAALAVFAERGYDGSRVREIAQRAGLSDAALYSHYDSKQTLALSLFHVHLERLAGPLDRVAGDTNLHVEERVRRIVWRILQAFAEEPNAVAFVIAHEGRFSANVSRVFTTPIRIVEGLVREGQLDGSVRPGPASVLAALVLGCVLQPIRSVLEAASDTADLRQQAARALIADAAWTAIARR